MNKSKKWLVIGIISLVLFAATAVCSFFFILPMMQKNEYFDYIKKGDVALAGDAQDVMDKLSDSDKKSAVEMTEDLIVKETNNYLSGKKSYDQLKNLLVTVENIKECWGMTADCFTAANKVELEKIYDELIATTKGSVEYETKKQEFKEVLEITYRNTDPESGEETINYLSYFDENTQHSYVETILNSLEAKLKETYDGYVTGTVSAEQLSAEADIMIDAVYSDYYYSGFANDVKEELAVITAIEESITKINSDLDQKLYNEAINDCKSCTSEYGTSTYFAPYKTKIDELQNKALEDGRVYYKAKFDELVAAKDKDGAQALYDQIKDNFGTDFNIEEIIGGMKPEWADAYIKLIQNFDGLIKGCMDSETSMSQAIKINSSLYDKDKPTVYLIADLDGNKTPEIIIMGDMLSYIFSYSNGQVVYVATTGFLGATATPGTYVTAYRDSGTDAAGNNYGIEDYAEFTYADGKVTVVSYAYGYADSTGKSEFEVNGQAADKDTFVSAGQGIIDKAANDFQVTGRLDEDYEAVISNYKE